MTGVTDRQIEELGIAHVTPVRRGHRCTPYTRQNPIALPPCWQMHPEDELKKAGAIYECKHGLIEPLQNDVVSDGRIITGQNQMASCQVSQLLMDQLQASLQVEAAE